MADYEDKKFGPIFPTRSGVAQGGATERQMLDNLEGSKSFRTKILDDGVGTVTTLRTRNGMPHFYTETSGGSEESYPWGLCAYPLDMVNHLTWSKPCVLAWDADTQSWKTVFYNPPQTSSEVPTLPASNEGLTVTYWFDLVGNVSLCCNKDVFYGAAHSGNVYSDWSLGSSAVGNQSLPAMPFIGNAVVGSITYKKFIIEQTTDHTKLISGTTELYDHYQERDYGGDTGVRAYDIQLPMSVSSDASYVLLQSAIAKNWGNRGVGDYTSDSNKYYWLSRISLPDLVVNTTSTTLPTYGALDVDHHGDSGVNDDLMDALSITTDIGYFDLSDGGSAVGYFSCRSTYPDGSLDDPYNPIYYIPKHNKFTLAPSPYPPTFLWKIHQFRLDTFTKEVNHDTIIGRIGGVSDAVDAIIRNASELNMSVRADGFFYRADADTVADSLWPLYNIGFFRGDTNEESNVRRLYNATDDRISIIATLGSLEIVLFEHTGSGLGSAEAKNSQKICKFVFKAGTSVWFEGTEGDLDKARFFGNSEIRGCSGFIGHPYAGDPIGSEYQARETVSSRFDQYNPKYTDAWVPYNTYSPYAGSAKFSGTSRTVISFDVLLEFVAYVEATVKSECAFTSPSDSWFIGLSNPQMTTVHTVEYYFVVRYGGSEYRTTLVNYSCLKPGPWDRQEIEDWLQWPWTYSMPGSIYTVGPPRVFPDVSKHRHVDNILQHQGVSHHLAGIPDAEARVIFATRFRIKDIEADWILGDYLIKEGKRGATDSPESDAYYYCPELKPMIEDNYYQIEFDQTGLRAWVGDMKTRTTINTADKENRDAVCYRV